MSTSKVLFAHCAMSHNLAIILGTGYGTNVLLGPILLYWILKHEKNTCLDCTCIINCLFLFYFPFGMLLLLIINSILTLLAYSCTRKSDISPVTQRPVTIQIYSPSPGENVIQTVTDNSETPPPMQADVDVEAIILHT